MLDLIYNFNIFSCLTMGVGLLLIQTSPELKDPHYRNAKRFLGIASIIVALCNGLVLYSRAQESIAEIFSLPVLVAAQFQAALFTFIVLILFHSPYVCKRNILKHLTPTFVFVVLYTVAVIVKPDVRVYSFEEYAANITNPALLLRTVFAGVYLVQIGIYVRQFHKQRKEYIAKIDNYFSDTDKYEFRWASRLFYEAASIGVSVLLFSMFPAPLFDAIITTAVTVFYFNFGVRYINYQYKMYYDALPAVNIVVEPIPQEQEAEQEPSHAREVKSNEETEDEISKLKLYLQQGVVLADYAAALKVQERKLSVFINTTYGKSFNQWVNTQRVEYAQKLVVDCPELNIEQVAEQSGFANKSQFSKIFKEITGTTFSCFKNALNDK